MAITIRVDIPKGAFSGYMLARETDLATAAKKAMTAVGKDAQALGRANIAAAGFSTTWQKAWQLKIYPVGNKPSLGATAFLANKIPYSAVFEEGATIRASGFGKLWVPFSSTPKLGGRRKTTPTNYAAAGVKLFTAPFKTRRGYPILATTVRGKIQPLFYGIDAVTLRKRFDLVRVSEQAANGFPSRFAEAFAAIES